MKLSIRRWRARYSATLVGGFLLLGIVFLLFTFVSGFTFPSGSPWPWLVLCLLGLCVLLYLRTISVVDRLQEDIEVIGRRAERIAGGEPDSSSSISSTSIFEMAELNKAITAIARKAEGDIAEMKRLEQVRSEFLGNVSHELRTPIFSVQGYLETLLDGAIDDPEVRDEFLEKAHNNMLRLHTLLNDLIEISRIESGAMKMSFRYFDLLTHCREIIGKMSSTGEINHIALRIDANGSVDSEGKIMVLGDKKRIEQALVNLVDNGIKYNTPGGEVAIHLASHKEKVRISVRDTGFGIPAEHVGRIFERFYRVDKGRSRDIGGSGLGLAIVKHIVEAHGSQICVESVAGSGTTFSFDLLREE